MSKQLRQQDQDDRKVDEGEDTEGHNMLLDPSMHRHLARSREDQVQKQVRDRQREKDARRR